MRVEQREEFEYHPLALLEEQGLVSLLGFHWQSIGPCVFSTFVSLLELGQEHVFVIVLDEWVGAKVIARLEPAAEQRLVSAREGLSSPTAWPKLVLTHASELIAADAADVVEHPLARGKPV